MKRCSYLICLILLVSFKTIAQEQSQNFIDSLLHLVETSNSEKEKVDLYVQLAEHIDASDSVLTVNYANKAIELAQKIGYKTGEIDAVYAQVSVAMSMGHIGIAAKGFQQVVDMSRAAGYRLGEANGLNGLGATRDFQGDYAQALDYLLLSLKISEEQNNKVAIASRCNNIGLVFSSQDDHSSAAKYLERALRINREIKDDQGIAVVGSNLGEVLMKAGQMEKAHEHFNRTLKLYTKLQDQNGIAYTHKNLADLCQKQEDLKKSLFHYKYALKIYDEIGGQYFISYAEIGLGRSYLRMQNWSMAKIHFEKGLALAQQLKHAVNIREGWKYLAIIEEKLGNYESALSAQKNFKQAADSILNTEKTKALTRLEADYEFQREKDSIAFVQQKIQLDLEKKIAKQRWLKMSAIVAAILISFIAFAIYKSYLIKRDKNKELTHKNEIIGLKNEELKEKNHQISDLLETEKKMAQENLEFKERELASVTMISHEKNTILQRIDEQIKTLSSKVGQDVIPDIQEIKRMIKSNIDEESWSIFTYQFEKVHPEFLNGLKEKYRSITQNDLRLCAFLKVGMDNKEIAQVSNITVAAVKKSLQRLKKKMDLGPNDDLRELLIKL